jgi:hypothetical protein
VPGCAICTTASPEAPPRRVTGAPRGEAHGAAPAQFAANPSTGSAILLDMKLSPAGVIGVAAAGIARTARWSRPALALAAAVTVSACLPNTYEIHRAELARLVAIDPALRGARVEVEQELAGSELERATPVTSSTQVVVVGAVDLGGGGYGRTRPSGGGGLPGVPRGGDSGGKKGSDARAAAVAILVMATFAVVVAAAIEAERFEGTVELHPMFPVHLFGRDGGYAVVPLAQLDPGALAWVERAVIRSTEGPLRFLDRAPLRRTGLSYGVHFGVTQLRSADGTVSGAPIGALQFGYFPNQLFGALATASFAWRENRVQTVAYQQRYGAELQVMPLSIEIFHAGVYGGGGLTWRLEDGFSRGNERKLELAGGGQLQLDVNTHIALTLRGGVYRSGDDLLREVTFGMSVY